MKLMGLVLVVASLAGCSAGDATATPTSLPPVAAGGSATTSPALDTSPTELPSSSPGPTGASPPTAPTPNLRPLPLAATSADATGAAAFARYWVDTFNDAQDAVDPNRVTAISAAGCLTCSAYIKSLRQSAALGETYQGGDVEITQVVAAPVEGDRASVLVNYNASALEVFNSAGTLSTTVPAERNGAFDFDLQYLAGRWVALEVAGT